VEHSRCDVSYLFRTVRIDESPGPDGRVDMHVRVTDAPPREVRFGIGYDTEEQIRGLATWRNYDFLGDARQLGFTARVSFIRRTLAADFLQPHFPVHDSRIRLLLIEQQACPQFVVRQPFQGRFARPCHVALKLQRETQGIG